MASNIQVWGDYGYASETVLEEFGSLEEAIEWVEGYIEDDFGGYKVIEAAEFLENGEFLCLRRWDAEDYDSYDGQPDEAQEWADFDPDC